MFSLSAKGVYGLSALIELGLHHSKGSMQIRDIAARHNMPQHYLEQILVSSKMAFTPTLALSGGFSQAVKTNPSSTLYI